MIVKHGAGRIKTVTTTAGSQQVEVGEDASVVKTEGKKVTVKVGDVDVAVELKDDAEVEEVKKMSGRKLAAYIVGRSNDAQGKL